MRAKLQVFNGSNVASAALYHHLSAAYEPRRVARRVDMREHAGTGEYELSFVAIGTAGVAWLFR